LEKETPHEKAAIVADSIETAIRAFYIAKPKEEELRVPETRKFFYRYLPMKVIAECYQKK
jgi:hypothetical protein